MSKLSDQQIIDAWGQNAAPWIATVLGQQIESRKLVTDQAVVDAAVAFKPNTVLDVGCGEGWLARRLSGLGMAVSGMDVVPELVEHAQRTCDGDFRVMAYEALSASEFGTKFDLAVCNFSLLGEASVERVFAAMIHLLHPGGHFVVQTLHPVVATGEDAYRDGWRSGSWAGFLEAFRATPPWYFRTIESWLALFRGSGLDLVMFREPVHPQTGRAVSLVMAGCLRR
ncbi:MAG: class I SAM-dependent methyltransferase [Planctomycetota bacterium]